MQVGALFAYPSAQCTGRFFAVVRTLLPVMIAELLFCALRNVDGQSTSDACHVDHLMMGDEVGQGTMGS